MPLQLMAPLSPTMGELLFRRHNMARARVLRKSVEFSRREGRPELAHLLLPRSNTFSLCVDAMRASSSVVYDMTVAYDGMNVEEYDETEEAIVRVQTKCG